MLQKRVTKALHSPKPVPTRPPLVAPFLGPLVLIILFLLFGPCLFNLFQRFLQERIQAISRDEVKTLFLLKSFSPTLGKGDPGP